MDARKQANEQIKAEYDKFYNGIYDGKVPVPLNFVELFKKGIMNMSAFSHKIFASKIKVIASRLPEELTNGDLNLVIKVIVNVEMKHLYSSFEESVEDTIKIQKFTLCYNEYVEAFKEQLEMKRVRLLDLATGGVPSLSNRIIQP